MCNYYTQKYGILDTLLCLFIFASFLLIQRIWIGGRLHYKQDSARNHRSLENHRPNCESVQHNYSQCYCHIGGTNHPYAVFCLSFSVIFVKKYVKNTFVKLYLHPVTLFENYLKCRIWFFFNFWWTFVHSICNRSSLHSQWRVRLFLWFSNTVSLNLNLHYITLLLARCFTYLSSLCNVCNSIKSLKQILLKAWKNKGFSPYYAFSLSNVLLFVR